MVNMHFFLQEIFLAILNSFVSVEKRKRILLSHTKSKTGHEMAVTVILQALMSHCVFIHPIQLARKTILRIEFSNFTLKVKMRDTVCSSMLSDCLSANVYTPEMYHKTLACPYEGNRSSRWWLIIKKLWGKTLHQMKAKKMMFVEQGTAICLLPLVLIIGITGLSLFKVKHEKSSLVRLYHFKCNLV